MKRPTAEQFSSLAHDTELRYVLGEGFSTPGAKVIGWAVPQTPSTSSTTKDLYSLATGVNIPTAAQFPALEHDTEMRPDEGGELRTPGAKTVGVALTQRLPTSVASNASSALVEL